MGINLVELVFNVCYYISIGEDEVVVFGFVVFYKFLVMLILVEYKEFFDGYIKIIFVL